MRLVNCLYVAILSFSLVAGCAEQRPADITIPTIDSSSFAVQRLSEALSKQDVQIIKLGDTLRLILPTDNFFQPQSTILNPTKISTLALIAQLLQYEGYPDITIGGHTDNVGSQQTKFALSAQQAHAIASYLWSKNVPLKTMTIIGYADSQPIADNQIPANSVSNRRIEITTNTQS